MLLSRDDQTLVCREPGFGKSKAGGQCPPYDGDGFLVGAHPVRDAFRHTEGIAHRVRSYNDGAKSAYGRLAGGAII